ncbi:transmembrane protein [Arabidopsis thaliana]|uniref:Transmembrane protein n=1 Tax=Arabidopsis thaliana TaxID=3702 RepID=A0A1P8BCT2_ARATH|nr:uncharacterized protein AT5G18735 [Arabidopsis thaliana]ANM69413.1 transmembrane protein [Arabidopsis thaliana]|eukprot:NP_001331093.1 transmembrane protein [Arabidopsis thaliana]
MHLFGYTRSRNLIRESDSFRLWDRKYWFGPFSLVISILRTCPEQPIPIFIVIIIIIMNGFVLQQLDLIVQSVIKNFNHVIKTKLQVLNINKTTPNVPQPTGICLSSQSITSLGEWVAFSRPMNLIRESDPFRLWDRKYWFRPIILVRSILRTCPKQPMFHIITIIRNRLLRQQLDLIVQSVIKNFNNVIKTEFQAIDINVTTPVSVYRPNFTNLGENGIFNAIHGECSTTNRHSPVTQLHPAHKHPLPHRFLRLQSI